MSSSDRKRVREANGDFSAAAAILTDGGSGFSDVDMDTYDEEPTPLQYRATTRRAPRILPHVPFYPRLGADEFDDDIDQFKFTPSTSEIPASQQKRS